MYNIIFFTNVLRILDEKGMTKSELASKADMSVSFLSDLTNGKANPSLKIMENLATALETPLPMLLESSDLDREALDAIAGGRMPQSLPKGFVRISAVLPEAKAFVVRRWEEEAKKKLKLQEKGRS
ncbi:MULTISPECIES: transcriptional regulator [Azotobacter]|uniref:Conjugal transfer protein TrbA n=2 Tax=Azotobacter TaxID=352 RepID=A0A0C4WKY1_9GAMM|nr:MULTISPECIES: transcriptional regulator [Azotobacter]AJE23483.1 Conjugal transfer protein TrbA [Azotobacter chroococcum NCIMB 8003]MDV7210065.1 transcriptional regulator [Azotobacter beijerinckii]SEQ93019.1 Helix-turn-helix [Azotobacter beijerinckii]